MAQYSQAVAQYSVEALYRKSSHLLLPPVDGLVVSLATEMMAKMVWALEKLVEEAVAQYSQALVQYSEEAGAQYTAVAQYECCSLCSWVLCSMRASLNMVDCSSLILGDSWEAQWTVNSSLAAKTAKNGLCPAILSSYPPL